MKICIPLAALLIAPATTLSNAQQYKQTNIVSSSVYDQARTFDPHLVTPWGLARSDGSSWWVADAGLGLSTLYSGSGVIESLTVSIPKANPSSSSGKPTGVVFSGYPEFVLTPGNPASFFFSTIDGTIAAWNPKVGLTPGQTPPSTHAVTVVKTTDGSDYTGLTVATIAGKPYLYAANFTLGRIDVYDSSFRPVAPASLERLGGNAAVPAPFQDPLVPSNFTPYNVATVGNDLVVAYANQFGDGGPGLGYADIYSSTGRLLRRLQNGNWFNAPWGIALAPGDFGVFSHDLLIGQNGFGGETQNSGTIAAFDLVTGAFVGQLRSPSGDLISNHGLRGLAAAGGVHSNSPDPAGAPAGELFFTAAPADASDGLLGYLSATSTSLSNGNDQ